jgi:hypothetical protein
VLLPSVIVNSPRSSEVEEALSQVVAVVAGELSCSKSIPPEPENVYEEVSSSDWRGRRKIKEQIEPEYEDGMSKLKIVEVLLEMVPK